MTTPQHPESSPSPDLPNEAPPQVQTSDGNEHSPRVDDSRPASPQPDPPDRSAAYPSDEQSPGEGGSGQSTSVGRGPLSLERIRQLRKAQEEAARRAKAQGGSQSHSGSGKHSASAPQSDAAATSPPATVASQGPPAEVQDEAAPAAAAPTPSAPAARQPGIESGVIKTPPAGPRAAKVAVPSRRAPLPRDLEQELSSVIEGTDLDNLLIGDELLQLGQELTEGQRARGQVVKLDDEFAFISLGGPNEGIAPLSQFDRPPQIGEQLDVVVRGYLASDGLYELAIPGATVDVDDWSDLKEGAVVEAVITSANTGGLECTVGRIRGFIPLSQIAEYRVENPAEYVGEKVLCVVTEANPRRGNLVLSRRAILERERQAKREERLASLHPGDTVEGVVRKILDFGAFVDLGGVDGLLHVSQLSWERVSHPSEILEEGRKVKVKIEKIDPQTGKISLSYRSLQEHPWERVEERFPVGSIHRGTVTRIAEFGAFVKLATGVEGLVHISELAHHRVSNVATIVKEGQEVDVKVLSVDAENQRMGLSMKAVSAPPTKPDEEVSAEREAEPPRRSPAVKHQGPLKGGLGKSSGGEKFGLKW
ncbi:MAG: hypothetical protein KatS3mg111_0497 [Pirellulaceae bacterium]|nr:MAG: hypothetical protein KatS3mg111_0497 [Pirellulaceae bacterium]